MRGPRSVAARDAGAAAPLALFAVALVARLVAAGAVDFPPTEPSAYYVGVARNIVEGRGLVADGVWSFASGAGPLPKPAFDLWLPMGTLLAVPVMAVLEPTLLAAQVAHGLLGATLAPMAWWIARDAGERAGVPPERRGWLALTAGLLVAVLGPLLVATAAPDSTTPFAVFATLAAILVPAALGNGAPASPRAAGALGVSLALAYLSRQEAVYVAVVYLVLVVAAARRHTAMERRDYLARALLPVIVGGLLVAAPWLVRNALTFGSGLASQVLENAFLTRSEEVFAWSDRPDAAAFLAQGADRLISNVGVAVVHNLATVLLVPAAAVSVAGLLALIAFRRSPALLGGAPLGVLVASGLLTFAATSILFPVATLAGTYLHAAGPTYVALAVLAALGGDAALAWLGRVRRWSRRNLWLAPLALGALAVPLAAFQLSVLSQQTAATAERLRSAAATLGDAPSPPATAVAVSDHPIWLAELSRRPVVALPDESVGSVWSLARHVGAPLVVIVDDHGRYPGAMAATSCFAPLDGHAGAPGRYIVASTCGEPPAEAAR